MGIKTKIIAGMIFHASFGMRVLSDQGFSPTTDIM